MSEPEEEGKKESDPREVRARVLRRPGTARATVSFGVIALLMLIFVVAFMLRGCG